MRELFEKSSLILPQKLPDNFIGACAPIFFYGSFHPHNRAPTPSCGALCFWRCGNETNYIYPCRDRRPRLSVTIRFSLAVWRCILIWIYGGSKPPPYQGLIVFAPTWVKLYRSHCTSLCRGRRPRRPETIRFFLAVWRGVFVWFCGQSRGLSLQGLMYIADEPSNP